MNKNLWLYIFIAMFAGVFAGTFFNLLAPILGVEEIVSQLSYWIALPGYVFIAIFKLLVIPLIVSSIIMAFAGHAAFIGLQKLGLITVGIFLLATIVAVLIGIGMAFFINPSSLIDPSVISTLTEGAISPATNAALTDISNLPKRLVSSLLTANPFDTLAKGEMLRIVIFSAIIGVGLLMLPTSRRVIFSEPVAVLQEACMAVITWTLRFTPIAVFGLLFEVSNKIGFDVFAILGGFVATVIGGLTILLLLYAVLLKLFGKAPLEFYRQIREAQLIAFSSSSSSATMPVTLRVAENNLKVLPEIYRFAIPLGTIINMNGTALFQATAAVFLASVFGVELGIVGILLIMILSVAAAIGTPTSPSAGLVLLTTILVAVGIPAEAVLIIVGVDRVLDMCRTTVNVTGNLFTVIIVDRFLGERNEE